MWQLTLAVGLGGFVGAIGRYGLAVALRSSDPLAMPWATLAANLFGCLAIGLVIGWFERSAVDPLLATGVTAGILGAFTTFATFGLETQRLVRGGELLTALVYVTISVVVGVGLVAVGYGVVASRGSA
jgi:CrcB protein